MSAALDRIVNAVRTIQALAPKERNLAIWLIAEEQPKPKAKRVKPVKAARRTRGIRCAVCHRMFKSRQALGTHTTRTHSEQHSAAEASA